MLLLNGLGYIGLLAALYFPLNWLKGLRTPLRWGLLLYTIVTLAGYFALHTPAQYDALGLLTKGIEVALLGLVIVRLLGHGAPASETAAAPANA